MMKRRLLLAGYLGNLLVLIALFIFLSRQRRAGLVLKQVVPTVCGALDYFRMMDPKEKPPWKVGEQLPSSVLQSIQSKQSLESVQRPDRIEYVLLQLPVRSRYFIEYAQGYKEAIEEFMSSSVRLVVLAEDYQRVPSEEPFLAAYRMELGIEILTWPHGSDVERRPTVLTTIVSHDGRIIDQSQFLSPCAFRSKLELLARPSEEGVG